MSGGGRHDGDGGSGGLSSEARSALRDARAPRTMSTAERRRTGARVARLALAPAAASLAWMWAKGLAVAAGVGLAGAVVVGTVVLPAVLGVPARRASAPATAPRAGNGAAHPVAPEPAQARPAAAPSAVAVAAPSEAVDAPPPARGAAPPLVARAARRPASEAPEPARAGGPPTPTRAPAAEPVGVVAAASAPPTRESDLAREVALVRGANLELARGEPARALALAEQHAREFVRGEMLHERELVVVDALLRLGRAAEARARGEALLARAPRSTVAERLRRLLAAGR